MHTKPSKRSSIPSELRLFLCINTLLSLLCLATEAFSKYVRHRSNRYDVHNWPVFHFAQWLDFRCFIPRFHYLHQARFFSFEPALGVHFMYPAPGALLYAAFYLLPHPIGCFLAIVMLCVAFAVVRFYLSMRGAGLASVPSATFCALTLAFSYPLWMEFFLGNMEICIWIFVAAGVWAFLSDKTYMAAAFFAIAGSIKIFPLVFLCLLLARKKYRPIAFAVGLILVLNVISLWVVCPNFYIAWHGIQNGLNDFRHVYVLSVNGEAGFDHSIFGLLKRGLSLLGRGHLPLTTLAHVELVYLPIVACVGFYLYFKYIRHLPVINQVLSLCVIAILFPPHSTDYTLMHLYVPLALLALMAVRKPSMQYISGLTGAFICLAVLMSPETEFIYHGTTFGGQLKALVLIALLIIGLHYPFESCEPLCPE